jgi:hypothetical protein
VGNLNPMSQSGFLRSLVTPLLAALAVAVVGPVVSHARADEDDVRYRRAYKACVKRQKKTGGHRKTSDGDWTVGECMCTHVLGLMPFTDLDDYTADPKGYMDRHPECVGRALEAYAYCTQ